MRLLYLWKYMLQVGLIHAAVFSLILIMANLVGLIHFGVFSLYAFLLVTASYLLIMTCISYLYRPLRHLIFQAYFTAKKIAQSGNPKDWDEEAMMVRLANENLSRELAVIKQEYRKKQYLLDSISDGICAIDGTQQIVFFNRRFFKKFIRPHQQFSFQSPRSLQEVFAQRYPQVVEGVQDVLTQGATHTIHELHLKHRERDFYFEVLIHPVIDEELKPFAQLILLFRDISQKRLSELMRVNFVANVSHELRTPLTSIIGFTELLEAQRQHIPAQLHPYIGKILANTQKMQTLFTDLLTLSVIESGHQTKKEHLPLRSLLERTWHNLQIHYPTLKATLHLELKADYLEVDPGLMEQVFINLFDNSFKYCDKPELHLWVTSAWKQLERSGPIHPSLSDQDLLEGRYAVFMTLKDNGPGIPLADKDRVFERFYRTESARAQKDKRGTGLGLSIVKQIINRHKGRIWIESTQLCLELPSAPPTGMLHD